jgi:hypothetical protein
MKTREEMRQQGYSPTAIAMRFGGPVGTDEYYKVMKEEGADLSGKCPHCGGQCFGTGDCPCMEE